MKRNSIREKKHFLEKVSKMWKKFISGLTVVVMCTLLYLPVQAAKENPAVKKNALPEEETGTVTIADYSPAEERSTVLFADEPVWDTAGQQHQGNVLYMDVDNESFVSYNLRGQFATFETGIVGEKKLAADSAISVGIFGDNILLYNVNITASTPIQMIKLVTGVGLLSIKTTYNKVGGDILLVDGIFTKAEHPTVYPNRTALYDGTFADHGEIATSESLYYDSALNVHEGAIELLANDWGESYVNVELNREFQFVVGKIIAVPETGNDCPVTIEIYLDEKLVFQQEGFTHDSPAVPFEIYVKDGQILQILATTGLSKGEDGGEAAPGAVVAITDAYLKRHEHTPGEWTQESESNCRDHGIRYMVCAECGERVVDEELPLKEHTPNGKKEVFKEPTCTEEGIQGERCSICGAEVNTEPVPVIAHVPGDEWIVIRKATCTEAGEEVRKCTVCGTPVSSRPIEKLDHNVSAGWKVIKEATCTSEGLQQKICVVCNEVVEEKVIPIREHEFTDWETLEGNYWSTPIVKERACKNCGFVEHEEYNGTAWIRPAVIVLCSIVMIILILSLPLKKTPHVKEFAPELLSYNKSYFADPNKNRNDNLNGASANMYGNANPQDVNSTDWTPNASNRTQVLPIGLDEAVNHDAEDWGQVRKMLDESDKISPDDEQK